MPVTKQKLIRHYALDRCLRNQTRRYYIEDLLAVKLIFITTSQTIICTFNGTVWGGLDV